MRCAPEGRVLSIVNGAFSARFAAIAKACGRETDVLEVPYGEIATLDMVADALAKQRYAAVTVGALRDVDGRAARRARHRRARARRGRGVPRGFGDRDRRRASCASTSGSWTSRSPARRRRWRSRRASPSPRRRRRSSRRRAATARRGLYFDLVEFDAYGAKNQTPNTPAINLFYAAAVQLAGDRGGGDGGALGAPPPRWRS